jgi:hypothetical protein
VLSLVASAGCGPPQRFSACSFTAIEQVSRVITFGIGESAGGHARRTDDIVGTCAHTSHILPFGVWLRPGSVFGHDGLASCNPIRRPRYVPTSIR